MFFLWAKDQKEIDSLFRLYYRPLYLYAARYLRDADDVEGIVQGTFLTSWEKSRAGQAPDSPKAYLYRIVPSTSRLLPERAKQGYGGIFAAFGGHAVTLGVFNVLNRHNPSMLAYDSDTKTWNQVSLFPIMPSLKYTLEFTSSH